MQHILPEAFDPPATPRRIDIHRLPEIETAVAIAGARHDTEVGGSVCFGVVIGVAVFSNL